MVVPLPLAMKPDPLAVPRTVDRAIGLAVTPALLLAELELPIPPLAIVAGGSLRKCACPERASETFAAFALAGVAKKAVLCA
jgi:hypothetical protein